MKKNYTTVYALIIIIALLFGVFYFMMPQDYDKEDKLPLKEFSTQRAMDIVYKIAKKPHYVGSKNHDEVVVYLQNELLNLGLQPSIQEGFVMTEKGTLVKAKNIIAKIKGTQNSKALLLLSHYDSAPHNASLGASDDASGIATILEEIRAFLHSKTPHKNDIIILFSDAEEIGLNGAALFSQQHPWAKNIGVILNFEARGASGPSYMLLETNKGNAKMIENFADAQVKFPVSNSLMYSIYKMLPNDTDLTVFRENNNIQGYNFAFIDSHYYYHTSLDNAQNLSKTTLAHQGSYLMPLLHHLSNKNLSTLNTTEDEVYFNVPFRFIHYPFSYNLPLLFGTIALFFIVIIFGLGKQLVKFPELIKGFVPLFIAIIACGIFGFVGWKLLLLLYPQYTEILHGFTYNGHEYLYAFISGALGICFYIYRKNYIKNTEQQYTIAPLFLWLIINAFIAYKLPGGSYFILPVIGSILMLGYYIFTQKPNMVFNLICSIPSIIILVPFIQMLPIGLGLKFLVASTILTALTFALLLPILGNFIQKKWLATLFALLSISFLVKAHTKSEFTNSQPKPNSLNYVYLADQNKAYYATYDNILDIWTKAYLGDKPQQAKLLNTEKLYSKYGSEYTYMNQTTVKPIAKPTITFEKDSIAGSKHLYTIRITPNRNVNRYDIFCKNKNLSNLIANGVKSIDFKSNISAKTSEKIISYYPSNQEPLEIAFSIPVDEHLDMTLIESSFDLLNNTLFSLPQRPSNMIAKPFVLNNAIVIKQKVKPSL